jgi:hypothetical protein
VTVPVRPRRQLQLSAQIQSRSWRIGRQVPFRASAVLASRSAEPRAWTHGDLALRKRPTRAASPHLTIVIGSDRRSVTGSNAAKFLGKRDFSLMLRKNFSSYNRTSYSGEPLCAAHRA